MARADVIIKQAQHTVYELRSIGEHQHADRVASLIRSRQAAQAENRRIHAAVRKLPPEVAKIILQS